MARIARNPPPVREAMRHVETTIPDATQAKEIVRTVLEERLASCAQWWPIESQYWWKGRLESADEVLVVFKTTLGRAAELRRRLQELHPNQVPYIATVRLSRVSQAYEAWTVREVRPRPSKRSQLVARAPRAAG